MASQALREVELTLKPPGDGQVLGGELVALVGFGQFVDDRFGGLPGGRGRRCWQCLRPFGGSSGENL